MLSSFTRLALGASCISSSIAYLFDANAQDNLAVYYGSTGATPDTSLGALCDNANIDMVVLTFITDVSGPGGYPTVDFTAMECTAITSDMAAAGAIGLAWCPDLASQINDCQAAGKKVFVSIGGALGTTSFESDAIAQQSAQIIWDTFGAGTGSSTSLRPFGDAVVDGFDIDNETGDPSYWSTFASTLRSLFETNSDKTFYLSAAPQCYFPSPSEPLDMLIQLDFVWPQYYDAPGCGVGTDGFESTVTAWSARLEDGSAPIMFIGAIAFEDNGGGGYVDPDSFSTAVQQIKALGLSNFGGVTLWDGANALENLDANGVDYIDNAKAGLQSQSY